MKNIFNSFYQNDVLIKPELASDWTVVKSNKINYINIQSKKINQTILIPVDNFVNFLNDEDIKLNGTKINGSFIFDTKLNMISEYEYKIWKHSDETNANIENKDLKVGYVYSLDSGLKCIYLGYKYVSELILDKYISFDRITEITKKKYILLHDEVIELREYIYDDSDNSALSENSCEELLKEYYDTQNNITYFEDKNIENPTYGFVKTVNPSPFLKVGDKYYTKVQNSNNIDTCWLFGRKYIKSDNKFEFELELNGRDFSQGGCIPITQNKSEEIELVRIGVIV